MVNREMMQLVNLGRADYETRNQNQITMGCISKVTIANENFTYNRPPLCFVASMSLNHWNYSQWTLLFVFPICVV